ncbi:MAG TPA: guanylate kinase [Nitrosomonas europaea]|uniref:Guanylate kinase n=1 Tax=Nitrosomonas europaea (strain ATCC 19718 / CIP 103999 / KCTC 2705 / NBRC 14298) TaxID=228410 RepID=KGUA_NITEU|nr:MULTISPECIES: guanylate kinase [Nitrosomonas]Q82SQ3.1 RecName: Full=Guanylate kinase; AltName: Full=GMP kinase [Nitrosomonas europaea ATCC 19718]MEB2331455.1 guanylate kinase [Nitrosomonas sp.]CAD86166.1 Guanylate kinase [Nitrosomonas europaea ATCC 19718]SDW61747.1 guanylate kinase [Nitrosomonas europaea]SET32828.1 guanylate kinase [Nitrosomonas europaea]SJZ72924.1 guanylate kinase [Nitrosomonas europaea]
MSCLFVISAPSGAGKTSVIRTLLQTDINLTLSISYTTRPPRRDEKNGHDYFFVDHATFKDMQARGEFLESAEVHGNLYGTSRKWIEETMAAEQDVLLEIDCQGAQQIRTVYPQAASIFILPPSMEALKQRLEQRGQDENKVIERRLAAARSEISHVNRFDYVVVNHELETAARDVASIVQAERLKTIRQLVRQRSLIAEFS